MSFESISQSHIGWRVACLESSEKLTIKIFTSKRPGFLTLILLFLFGWGFGFFGQLQMGLDPDYLCVGVLIILFPLFSLLWNLVGKEIIIITSDKIVLRQTILGVGLSQTYQLSQVSNLRSSLSNPALFTFEKNMREWGFTGGSIAYDYKGRVCRFGLLLSKEDADVLVTKINQYLAPYGNSHSTSVVNA